LTRSNDEYKKLTTQLYDAYEKQYELNDEMQKTVKEQEKSMVQLLDKYK